MKKSGKFDINEVILKVCGQGYQKAFEKAVWTGTPLVFIRNGKLVEEKPPYRYELVPIKSKSNKKKS